MQWQRTTCSLHAKSMGEHLKRHSQQHTLHWLIRQSMSLSFGLGSALLPQHSLYWQPVSESPSMLAKPCAWGSPSWSTNSLWIALNSPLNSHGCPGALSHIKMFLSSVLKREGSGIAAVLLFCVIEDLFQHDRFCHLYIFCVIQLWWSCLSTFTNEEYSLRVWLKLQISGVLWSKPNEDLAIVICFVWYSGRCSLLPLSLWQLLATLYILYIWLVFQ